MDVMHSKTCDLLSGPVLSLLYFVFFFIISAVPFSYGLDIHCYIILQFHFEILETSKPEEGWSNQPKYRFQYTTLYQPCSILDLHRFTFQVWLIRSPVRSDVQSSRIFVHGFAVYLVFLI